MLDTLSSLSLTPLSLARGTSFLVGGLGVFMGIRAILRLTSYAVTFGFHPSTTAAQSAASNPFPHSVSRTSDCERCCSPGLLT